MSSVGVFSPAKLNLFLAVTGRRADGYHDLVSVAVPVGFGDVLRIEADAGGEFELECDDVAVPTRVRKILCCGRRGFLRRQRVGAAGRDF